jgi:hypothetical protein
MGYQLRGAACRKLRVALYHQAISVWANDMGHEINPSNFQRIQRVAIPLVDTLDTALARILDFYENHAPQRAGTSMPAITIRAADPVERTLDPFSPPDLTHTKVTAAVFRKRAVGVPTWNALLDEVIRASRRDLGTFDALNKISLTNLFDGQKTDQGYRYLADIRLSVQGQSANDAWRSVARIVRQLGYQVQVNFVWYAKEAAAFPGESGSFSIEGRGE